MERAAPAAVEAAAPVAAEPVVVTEALAVPQRPAIGIDDIRYAAFLLSQRRGGPPAP